MFDRLLKLPKNYSFFLFGARNTGKSTLIRACFPEQQSLWIDLLAPELEAHYVRNPSDLKAQVLALSRDIQYVIIDEVQKAPKLLDIVHDLTNKVPQKFILSGSSARKLKHGGANLLAGRAFVFHLYPLSFLESGQQFNLQSTLSWGALPEVYHFSDDAQKKLFLQAYSQTYLNEEIWSEQLVRKLQPFRRFLEVAAQCSGKIINMANIARDTGCDEKTVRQYFSILEDTLLGFFLEPFVHSFRKRLSKRPKFYFFDLGVVRALSGQLSIHVQPRTHYYGDLFEHFIILECLKLNHYYHLEYRLSYIQTKDGAEVDLVVERPGQSLLLIEIKSTIDVQVVKLRALKQFAKDLEHSEAVVFSNDPIKKVLDGITVWPWQQGIQHYFVQ